MTGIQDPFSNTVGESNRVNDVENSERTSQIDL